MKKLFLIAFYFFALTVYSQNPTPFDNSIRVKNLATQSGTPDIAVFDNNKVLKKIAWASLPSSVLEYTNFAAFPGTGAVAKIYVDKATNIIYRWSGSAYVILSPFTTPTLDQVMETGRIYEQTIGNETYTLGFNPPFPFGSLQFAAVVKNNNTGTYGGSYVSDTYVGMGITENPTNFKRYTANDQSLEEGHSIRTWDNRGGEQFLNELKIPFKTSEAGISTFSIPNNKPAGEYDLLASDGNDLLLQANANWKIGDYVNDQLAFIEGSASLETIFYRTNNNIFKGIILPDTDNNYDIGNNSFRFKDAYFSGDVKVNGNSVLTQGVTNTTTVVLSSSTLNSTYPTATTGFKVYCTSITAGKKIYEKTPTGWVGYDCIIP